MIPRKTNKNLNLLTSVLKILSFYKIYNFLKIFIWIKLVNLQNFKKGNIFRFF